LKKLYKKAQSSIEFMVLVTFMMIIFTIFAMFIYSQISQTNTLRNREYVNQIKSIVFSELEIAESMTANYTKEFILPSYVDGNEYTINLTDGAELLINFRKQEYIYFLSKDVFNNSFLKTGTNTLYKLNNISNRITYSFNTIPP